MMNKQLKNKCFMKGILFLFIFMAGLFLFPASAQTSCDKLFSSGVQCQQTMTIASQNKAITYFEKAKVCYDSKAKKDLCDQQIKACRNIISQLSKKKKTTPSVNTEENKNPEEKLKPVAKPKVEKRVINLSIDCNYLKFKSKGGELKKAKIMCNYNDWKIADKPDWISCSRNDNDEIIVEATKNPTKEERSGLIKIACDDKEVTLTVIQEKSKKLGIF